MSAAMRAAILRIIALATPPNFLSTDVYRYVWDGRVQGAGINPYLYIPSEPEVASLRDDAIYPHINRLYTAPTIYPPFAQMVFFAVTRFAESVSGIGPDGEHAVEHGALTASTVSPAPSM